MKNQIEQVVEFNSIGGQVPNDNFRDLKVLDLKLGLIAEEFKELSEASYLENRVEVLDALADILYVVYGFAWSYGLDKVLPEAFERVHKSNMSKFPLTEEEANATIQKYYSEGIPTEAVKVGDKYTILKKENGKILKSINYNPVNLKDLV